MKQITKQIHSQIMQGQKFLIIGHQNPDGDAVGSVAALAHMLDGMGKTYTIFCATGVPRQFWHVSYCEHITQDPHVWDQDYDAIIVCDSGDLHYAGVDSYIEKKSKTSKPFIINIDHHVSNILFGNINLVKTDASSTTEILYFYFHYNNIKITREMATALLTGLIYDTGNFTNSGTSKHALHVASKLIQKGAEMYKIKQNLINNKPFHILQLWARVLSRLEKYNNTEIVYTFITQQDLAECNASEDDASGIANLLNDLQDGKVSMVLRERTDGSIKGSFRTTYNTINVSMLAKQFGGGGHPKASGFTIEGKSDVGLYTIWETLDEFAENGYTINTH